MADGDGLADFMLALGQDGTGFAGDIQGQFVKVLLKQITRAAQDAGLVTRGYRHPGLLGCGGRACGAGHIGRVGNAHGAQHLPGGGLDHVTRAATQCGWRQRRKIQECRGIGCAHLLLSFQWFDQFVTWV